MISQSELDSSFSIHDNAFSLNDSIDIIKMYERLSELVTFKMRHNSSFSRNIKTFKNPIEMMINDYLEKIGDKSPMVEYWMRDVWLSIECHQDLDECKVDDYGIKVNPNHGHIMYLSESCNEAGTVFFTKDNNFVSIVYPKIGRIVRFNGECFHYVPNPIDYMFGNNKNNRSNKKRYVLLFNTWNEYQYTDLLSNLKSKIFKLLKNPQFKSKDQWNKVNLFDSIPLQSNDFSFRVKYMGNSIERFGKKRIENFFVDRRFQDDGISQQLLIYQIRKIEEDNLIYLEEDDLS